MQHNSSHWLRRMREKHRRIWGMNKQVHSEEVQLQQENSSKTGMNGNKVVPIEQSRFAGDRRRPYEDQRSTASMAELEADVWELRKQFILQIAKRRNGKIKLQEVAAECNVNIRIAAGWLIRLSTEGMLSLVAGQRNTMTYLVKEVGATQK